MSAVSINGIHLNLNVEVDDAELKDKVNELIDAVEQLTMARWNFPTVLRNCWMAVLN